MANSVPGHVGLPGVGETCWQFYKDPLGYVEQRMRQYDSPVFKARMLNTPTVFVTTNEGVRQILDDEIHLNLGYKAFMKDVYGTNILFTEGPEAQNLRQILKRLLHSEKCQVHSDKIIKSEAIDVYTVFKKLATEMCLEIFLDINVESSRELADKITRLSTSHWHGIISIPLNFKIPWLCSQGSTYSQALNAKGELLSIIKDRLRQTGASDGFLEEIGIQGFSQSDSAADHVLLFASALAPKAIASLLTSFVIVTAGQVTLLNDLQCDSSTKLECVMLEVQRLWPPFLGGRRKVQKECDISGYKVQAGNALVFMTHHAHRDAEVFSEPNEFRPERWLTANAKDKDKLFTFGAGARDCIGRHLVDRILQTVCSSLVSQYRWQLADEQAEVVYKWLPVSRPKEACTLHFRSLCKAVSEDAGVIQET